MRWDMHKVIVERPRLGSSAPSRKTALRLRSSRLAAADAGEDYDSGPRRASSGRSDKSLNENLAPLERYLRSQVGRPWAKVYGEVRQGVDTRSAIGLHVLQHVPDLVETDTFLDRGQVCALRWGRPAPMCGLYVHPVTGILRDADRSQRKRSVTQKPEPEPDVVRVSEELEYRKLNGLWFRFRFRVDNQVRFLIEKRQCDKKTIRQLADGRIEPAHQARA